MNMITGTVNKRLMPIIPVEVRNEDRGWEQLELLLDTGFDGGLYLKMELLHHHRLETRPPRQLLTPEFTSERYANRGQRPAFTVEASLDGAPREASLLILDEHSFSGMLGTEMLKFRRVTVDVVEGGPATVETFIPKSGRGMGRRQLGKRKRPRPFRENPEDYEEWMYRNLPWTGLQIQDGEGYWHAIWVNVDTGSSEELSLPPKWVSRLGLHLPNGSQMETVNGPLAGHSGKVEIIMKGERRCIECFSRNDGAPPLIGMKLLEGSRITMDFEDFAGANVDVEIKPIPRSRPYVGGFLRSLADRFHV